ncbi:MAG: hypothetical protein KJ949_01435 [Nanoarchaeota archaeon]|nr:hypothetical protein [Nanoarchaeota archaeon]
MEARGILQEDVDRGRKKINKDIKKFDLKIIAYAIVNDGMNILYEESEKTIESIEKLYQKYLDFNFQSSTIGLVYLEKNNFDRLKELGFNLEKLAKEEQLEIRNLDSIALTKIVYKIQPKV